MTFPVNFLIINVNKQQIIKYHTYRIIVYTIWYKLV